jgi:pyruvate kinase
VSHQSEAERLSALFREVRQVREHALAAERLHADAVEAVRPRFRPSARNLVHYLALRSLDLRPLQEALAPLGLSSLGRTESHALASLNAVCRLLGRQLQQEACCSPVAGVSFSEGRRLIEEHAADLLGPAPGHHPVRIMVTLPSQAADDEGFVRELIEAGMDVARINCAHDDADSWRAMARNVRLAAEALGRPCRVEMDLGGPKLRTGPLEPGPRVVRWRPTRDLRGRTVHPARLWLAPSDTPPPAYSVVNAWLPIDDAEWLESVRPGDRISLRDARGRKRRLMVVDAAGPGRWTESQRTGYAETGTELRLDRGEKRTTRVGELPAEEQVLVLREGDRLILTAGPEPGRPPGRDGDGRQRPARIPCTLPEVFGDVAVGDSIKFDDGRVEGVITRASCEELEVEITRARPRGSRLRADKGINLPDSALSISGLTAKDRADLDVVVEVADVVGLSFVNTPHDVRVLQDELTKRGAEDLGILLKIETERAFQGLPGLLLTAMRSRGAAVMIARGDLAVECGWDRLAELQEEILWICEAAHMPVVWATQVLESLAKEGIPSRAEITDAAMANRAECVMLNKGPHILDAIRTLDAILLRMDAHQHKKTHQLSCLKLWRP